MKKTEYTCDRCGHVSDEMNGITINDYGPRGSIDLCLKCYQELRRWITETTTK